MRKKLSKLISKREKKHRKRRHLKIKAKFFYTTWNYLDLDKEYDFVK